MMQAAVSSIQAGTQGCRAPPVLQRSSHAACATSSKAPFAAAGGSRRQFRLPRQTLCRSSTNHNNGQPAQDPAHPSSSTSSSSPPSSTVLQTDPVQLVELLAKLSQLNVRPHQQWLQEVLDTLAPSLQDLSTAQLASTLQVLGSWAYTPPEAFMQQLHAAVRQTTSHLTMRDIADMAWGLAQLQHPRQPMLDELLEAARELMLSSSCISDARSSCATSSSSFSSTASGQWQQQQPVCCPASLADLVWSCAKLQHSPDAAWLGLFATTSKQLLPLFTPNELAQVVWAFARLPYNPGQPWLDALFDAITAKLRDFDSKAVSLTAWGLATLKVSPSTRWLFAFERQAERTLASLAAAELACTLWALSELKSKRAHELRLGRLVRRQEAFLGFDFEALANPRLLRVVRQLTLGPQQRGSSG